MLSAQKQQYVQELVMGKVDGQRVSLFVLCEMGRGQRSFAGFTAYHGRSDPTRSGKGAGRGQGLAVFVRDDLSGLSEVVKCTHHTVWVQVKVPGRRALSVCGVYLPPPGSESWHELGTSWEEVAAELQADVLQYESQGDVCLLGDFNVHTSCLDDRGVASDSILDSMGVMGAVSSGGVGAGVPVRANVDVSAPGQEGKQFVDMCVASKCLILNGRAPGDEQGAATFVGWNGSASTVIDYGVVSRGLYPHVQHFTVLPNAGWSDHNSLFVSVRLAHASESVEGQQAPMPVKWDPEKREVFRQLLKSPEYKARRSALMAALQGGVLSVGEVSQQWSRVLLDAAQAVFGCGGGRRRRFGGRQCKRWFQHCKEEYAALQAALHREDSHAAAVARKVFVNKKRRVQRQLAQARQESLLRDVKHNPRRFWTAYKRGPPQQTFQDVGALTDHWQGLYAAQDCGGLRESYSSVSELVQHLAANSEGGDSMSGDSLSAIITVEEVEAAVRKLGLGRMVGPDLLRGEFFRGLYAELMVPHPETGMMRTMHVYDCQPGEVLHDLCALLNAAFSASEVPVDWCATYLSAIFKKGDPSQLDNYRGIAVGSAPGKVFSLVLHRRLADWSESHGHRANAQAGFRDDHRTCDHVFVLKHLVDRSRAPGSKYGKLYTCFVDFRKAYDLVRRDLLLKCLSDLGVEGKMLGALASMYWSAPMTVKNGSVLGATFNSTRGVKQGDPLSPLLFGLFIDRLEGWVTERLGDKGVELGAEKLRMLLYADDLTLLATSAQELQLLLDCLQSFCDHYQMHVNVAKCAVVVFGRKKPSVARDIPPGGWRYKEQPVPCVQEFRYLGIVFHETKGVSACVDALHAAGLRAMWGMLGRCADIEVASLEIQVQLFDALVAPVLGFCADVWAPTLLRGAVTPKDFLDNALQRVQALFMRRLGGGLRRSTSRMLMFREFGCRPLVRGWLQGVIGLWNRMQSLPESNLLRAVLSESLTLGGEVGVSWLSDFTALLSAFDALPVDGLFIDGVPCNLSAPQTLAKFDKWFYSCWCDLPADPRSAPASCVSCCKYQNWFAVNGGSEVDPLSCLDRGRWTDCPDYVRNTAGLSRERVRALASFRLCAHDLDVETGKWKKPRNGTSATGSEARSDRLCRLCQQKLGDELHMVAECPEYDVVRRANARLFDALGGWLEFPCELSDGQFRSFMHQSQHEVAAFLHECAQRRWKDPPLDVLYAEGLSEREAEVFYGGDGVVDAEESEQYYSACSQEYYEVYSDAYYDVMTP